MKIFIVIPAYNEVNSIKKVLLDLKTFNYLNIVVVDDGSDDGTAEMAESQGVVVLRHIINRGMGAALQTGNDYALSQAADIIVHFDADGQMQAKDIEKLVQPIITGKVDITLGSRFLVTNSDMPWSKKRLVLPLSKLVNYFFTKLWLTDAHNGFRSQSRLAAEKIKISHDRMAHNTEIVEKIKKYKLNYLEVPVEIKYFEYGQGVKGGFKILKDLLLGKLIR